MCTCWRVQDDAKAARERRDQEIRQLTVEVEKLRGKVQEKKEKYASSVSNTEVASSTRTKFVHRLRLDPENVVMVLNVECDSAIELVALSCQVCHFCRRLPDLTVLFPSLHSRT